MKQNEAIFADYEDASSQTNEETKAILAFLMIPVFVFVIVWMLSF